jgi:hypothetical protein
VGQHRVDKKDIPAGKTEFTGHLYLRNIAEEEKRCVEQEQTW